MSEFYDVLKETAKRLHKCIYVFQDGETLVAVAQNDPDLKYYKNKPLVNIVIPDGYKLDFKS